MEEIDLNTKVMCLLRRCYTIAHSRMAGGKTSQSEIMRIIHRHGPKTQKQLAEKMDIRQASLSEVIAKMEESGLITKTRDRRDHRVTVINLTEKGLEITLANREKHHRQRNELLSCFTTEEKQELAQLLDKLYTHMEESEGNRQ
ncbi:MAG: MarR family winged helix-turn-helix transcriptional regulator [Bulleidia sp.]